MVLRQLLNNIFIKESNDIESLVMRELHYNPAQDIYGIQKKYGLDAANLFFYRRTLGSSRCRAFRRIMDEQAGDFSIANQDVKVLVVGSPEVLDPRQAQITKEQWQELASDAGFKDIEWFQPKANSLLDGALQLKRQFQQLAIAGQKVLLLSNSHGSGFARFAIDQTPRQELAAIMAWINVSGLVFGSPRYHCSDNRGFFARRQQDFLRSFSCEQKYFIRPVSDKIPAIVSFLGCRPSTSMSASEKHSFYSLRHWGPNDGMISFREYERMPGFVIPLWGQGHNMNLLTDRKIIQKTMCYLVDICKANAGRQWKLADLNFVVPEKQHELQLL